MVTALGLGITAPHDMVADRMLATALPIAERCVDAKVSLWLRAWPARTASDVWIVLAALLERVPRLIAGVVASFPPSTRVSDIEDLLVIDNLAGGRVELAFAPDADAEAITEVCAALRGEAVRRPDPGGTPRSFMLTPRPARGSIPTWIPLTGATKPAGASIAWQLDTAANGTRQAVLVSAESFGTSTAAAIVDLGPRPSVDEAARVLARTGQ